MKFFSLFSVFIGYNIIKVNSISCNSGAGHVLNSDINACKCSFSDGLYGAEAQMCCGNGYHICTSANEMLSLGGSRNLCYSIIPTDEAYWSLESSVLGFYKCDSEHGQTGGLNDVWGCTGSTDPRAQFGTGIVDLNCQGVTNIVGRGGPHDFSNSVTSNGYWDFGDDDFNEVNNLKVLNAEKSGLLCCKDPPTPPPTPFPTPETANPTPSPTMQPTKSPTIKPSQEPTYAPTSCVVECSDEMVGCTLCTDCSGCVECDTCNGYVYYFDRIKRKGTCIQMASRVE